MEKRIKGENGITYVLKEDGCYYPELEMPPMRPVGRFGRMHLEYIKVNKRGLYTGKLLTCTLNGYLADLDEQANKLFDRIVSQMAEARGVNEELKAANQMEWVGIMNNIRHVAEEIVFHELIYK